ncbi:hypothetical protein EJ110_NYTH52107 [Nymphaea thermarum]|nr:hypothetical protein EJ110_NYTH52107 [Nymphaea thermarum]
MGNAHILKSCSNINRFIIESNLKEIVDGQIIESPKGSRLGLQIISSCPPFVLRLHLVKDPRSDHTERGVGYISSTNNERAVGYISTTKCGTTLACNPYSCKEDVTERGNLIESVKTRKVIPIHCKTTEYIKGKQEPR